MNLFRFKSNRNTVVHRIGENLVQIVWSTSFEHGGNCSFCYSYEADNLEPLTEAECQEVVLKREARRLDTHIGGWTQPPPFKSYPVDFI